MITLKEHNIKPYEELCRMLETQDKVAYVSATGTGKSYVVGKYIEDHGLEKETIILVPSIAIKSNWEGLMPTVAINTYQGLSSGKINLKSYALIVCDEMHHLGADVWGAAFQSGIENFSGKIIGLSATPVRYLDEQRDISNEYFYGNRVEGLDLPKAITEGVLPTFDYIAALYNVPKKMEKYRGRSDVTDNLFTQLDYLSSSYSFQKILKKHLDETNKKTAVFVGYVRDIEKIKTLCEEAFPEAEHIEAYAEMGNSISKERIAQFENSSKRAFFYSVDLLNEGVHIDGVDSVVMFRRTKSPAVYLQQIGRALSADNKRKRVKIFDFVANHGNLEMYKGLNNGTLTWIASGISDPEKQIVICDYALEVIEILDRIENLLGKSWTEDEDNIIRKYYDSGSGVDKVTEMLAPKRTRRAVKSRASILGIASKNKKYSKELIDDIVATYPMKNGLKVLLKRYPHLSASDISSAANRNGATRFGRRLPWTDEEDKALLDNAYLSAKELIKMFPNRSLTSISNRRKELGISFYKKWTKEDDQILIDNNHLSSVEIRDRFFPDLSRVEVNNRRYKKLNLPRSPFWTPENTELFKKLYAAGGKEAVMNNPTFSKLPDKKIVNKAYALKVKAPDTRRLFSADELMLIADFISDSKGETIKDFSMKLNGRTPEAVASFIRKIKSEKVDLHKKIEETIVREAKEAEEAQNA